MVSVDSVNIWALVDFPAWNLSILSAQKKYTLPGTRSSPSSWWRRAEGRECLPSPWRELHGPPLLCVSRISFHIDPGCGRLPLTLHFWWRYNLSPASCAKEAQIGLAEPCCQRGEQGSCRWRAHLPHRKPSPTRCCP